jgi:hypothetical protein
VVARASGCSSNPAAAPPVEQNLHNIATAYDKATKKTGRLPQSAEELKPFLQPFGDPDVILVSPNDGQPFVIHWDVVVFRPGPNGSRSILAHEAVGVDGKKYVIDNMKVVQQMTEAELNQALNANK